MTKPTILLVDYDPASAESILAPLIQAGYEVSVAKNGPAGLEAFRRIHPDLVLTQMMLPKMAGLDLCREIRKSHSAGRPPILVFDTSPVERGRPQAIAAGANGYVVAPIAPDTLVDTCNEYLMGTSVDLLDFAPREEGPDGDPSQADPAADGDAAAEEILKQLDALLPSKPMDLHETPHEPPSPAVASRDPGVPEETPSPSAERESPALACRPVSSATAPEPPAAPAVPPVEEPAPRQMTVRPAPTVSEPTPPPAAARSLPAEGPDASRAGSRPLGAAAVPTVARSESRPIPRPGRAREKSPWPKVLVPVALAAGLVAAVLYGWGRLRPVSEPTAPEISAADTSAVSPTPARVAEAPEEQPTAPAPSADDRVPASATILAQDGSPGVRPASPAGVAGTAERTRPEPARAAPPASSPAVTGGPPERAVEPPAVAAESEAVPTPAPPPADAPAPVAAEPAPRSDDLVRESPTPAPADSPAETAPSPVEAADAPPVAPVRPGDFVEAASVDVPPVAKTRAQPAYPERALRMRQSGAVVLAILVDETGRVAEVAPQDGSARQDFLAAATRAVRSWTYSPAMKNGVPVKTRIAVRIDFQLKP